MEKPQTIRFTVTKISSKHVRLKRILEVDFSNSCIRRFSLKQEDEYVEYPIETIKSIETKVKKNIKRIKISFKGGADAYQAIFQTNADLERFLDALFVMRRINNKADFDVSQGENMQEILIFCGTWNCGNAAPPDDLSEWIPTSTKYDLYFIAIQEGSFPLGEESSRGYDPSRKVLIKKLENHIGDGYTEIIQDSLWDMRVLLMVKNQHLDKISSVEVGKKATGIANLIGNKGGIVVSFRLYSTRICFCGSHLAAHQDKIKDRALNYKEIVSSASTGLKGMDLLSQHHFLFWLGDLNYRISLPREVVLDRIEKGKLDELKLYDQLKSEIDNGNVFCGFCEAEIDFLPTYKMKRGNVGKYDDFKERVPSWTDRVLYRLLPYTCYSTKNGEKSKDDTVKGLQIPQYFRTQLERESFSRVPVVGRDFFGVNKAKSRERIGLANINWKEKEPDQEPSKLPVMKQMGSRSKSMLSPATIKIRNRAKSVDMTTETSHKEIILNPLSRRINQLFYRSATSVCTSDHTPVSAVFRLSVPLPTCCTASPEKCTITIETLSCYHLTAMDRNGFSDPYFIVSSPCLPDIDLRSTVKQSTLFPVWSKPEMPVLSPLESSRNDLATHYLHFRLMDKDVGTSDDLIGYFVVPLEILVLEGECGFDAQVLLHGRDGGIASGRLRIEWEKDVNRKLDKLEQAIFDQLL